MASKTEPLAPPLARPNPVLATAGYAVVYLARPFAEDEFVRQVTADLRAAQSRWRSC